MDDPQIAPMTQMGAPGKLLLDFGTSSLEYQRFFNSYAPSA
jgi:hypothetical protein